MRERLRVTLEKNSVLEEELNATKEEVRNLIISQIHKERQNKSRYKC